MISSSPFYTYSFYRVLFSFSSLCPDSPSPHHMKHILFIQSPLNRFHVSFQSQKEVESWHVLSHIRATVGPGVGLTLGYRVFVRRRIIGFPVKSH